MRHPASITPLSTWMPRWRHSPYCIRPMLFRKWRRQASSSRTALPARPGVRPDLREPPVPLRPLSGDAPHLLPAHRDPGPVGRKIYGCFQWVALDHLLPPGLHGLRDVAAAHLAAPGPVLGETPVAFADNRWMHRRAALRRTPGYATESGCL